MSASSGMEHHVDAKQVEKHCKVSSGTTAYALVTSDGRFLKLNDAGNTKAMQELNLGASTGSTATSSTTGTSSTTSDNTSSTNKHGKGKVKNVTITGTVHGDTLNVDSISSM